MKKIQSDIKFKSATEAVNALGRLLKAEPGSIDRFEIMDINVAAVDYAASIHDLNLTLSFNRWIGKIQRRHGLW